MSVVITERLLCRDLRNKISANIEGTCTQSGTPTPTAPIDVLPLQTDPVSGMDISSWNLNGISTHKDIYNYSTKKITRNIKKYVLTGEESWELYTGSTVHNFFKLVISDTNTDNSVPFSNYYKGVAANTSFDNMDNYSFRHGASSTNYYIADDRFTTAADFKSWLATQYAAKKPVILYYPLATSVEEDGTSLIARSLLKGKYPGAHHKIVHTGKNLLSVSIVQGSLDSNGNYTNSTMRVAACLIPVEPNKQYTLSMDGINGTFHFYQLYQKDTETTKISNVDIVNTVYTFTTNSATKFISISVKKTASATISVDDVKDCKFQLEEGSTATTYEPYIQIEKTIGSIFDATINTKKEVND